METKTKMIVRDLLKLLYLAYLFLLLFLSHLNIYLIILGSLIFLPPIFIISIILKTPKMKSETIWRFISVEAVVVWVIAGEFVRRSGFSIKVFRTCPIWYKLITVGVFVALIADAVSYIWYDIKLLEKKKES